MFRPPHKKFLTVFFIIFVTEFLIMYAIGHQREEAFIDNLKVMLLDSIALSFVVAPTLYYFLVQPLETSLREIKILKGIISVCSVCKKVQAGDDQKNEEHWVNIEKFVQDNSDVLFSHGYCPNCYKKTMENVEKIKKERLTKRT